MQKVHRRYLQKSASISRYLEILGRYLEILGRYLEILGTLGDTWVKKCLNPEILELRADRDTTPE